MRSEEHPAAAPVGRQPATQAHLSQHGSAHVIRLSGDLDAAGAPVLTEAIADLLSTRPATATTVVVDLSTIGVLAAAGITALIQAEQACDGVVQLCWVAPERVLRVVAAVGLADDIAWFDTPAHALAACVTKPERQLDQRTDQLTGQPVIEQAKGMLMKDFALTDHDAFDVLASISQDANTKLCLVAADVVELLTGTVSQDTAHRSFATITALRDHLLDHN